MTEVVTYQVDGHVATITYNRPEALNAINGEMRRGLNAAFSRFRDEEEAWVAIVTGAGRAFCAGADMRDGAGSVGEFPGTFWEKPTANSFESGAIAEPSPGGGDPVRGDDAQGGRGDRGRGRGVTSGGGEAPTELAGPLTAWGARRGRPAQLSAHTSSSASTGAGCFNHLSGVSSIKASISSRPKNDGSTRVAVNSVPLAMRMRSPGRTSAPLAGFQLPDMPAA